MSWTRETQAQTGRYLLASVTSGFSLDVFGSVSTEQMVERIQQYARGWRVVSIMRERGIFGVGSSLQIYGQAEQDVSTAIVEAQVAAALNSFWTMGGVRAVVMVSASLTMIPPSNEWSGTIQLVAVAAIVLGLAWGAYQIRKVIQ